MRRWTLPPSVRRFEGLLWGGALLILVAVFLSQNGASLSEAVRTARRAAPGWVAIGLLFAIAVRVGMVHVLWLIARRLHPRLAWLDVARAEVQRLAFGTLSPVPGPGVVAFTRSLHRGGVSTDNALLTLTLNSLVGYGSFVLYLVPALAVVGIQHGLSSLMLAGAALLLVIFLAMLGLAVAMFRPAGPPHWLARHAPVRLRDTFDVARAHRLRARDLAWPLIIASGVELAGAGIFLSALRALGEPSSLGTAVAAYGVATLFMLVAPFFSGLGLVEVGSVVVLQQLGVPPGIALGATVLYRIAELWMPLAFALSFELGSHNQVRATSAHVPALMAAIAGAMTLVAAAAPHFSPALRHFGGSMEFGLPAVSRTFAVLAGALLIYLSYHLWQRRRSAWVLAVVLLGALVPLHLIRTLDSISAATAAFALLLLLLHARRFTVRSDIPTIGGGIAQLAVVLLVTAAYGTLGFYLLDARAFGQEFNAWDSVQRAVRTAFLFDTGLDARTEHGRLFLDSLRLLGGASMVVAAVSIARPVVERRRVPPAERERAKRLIESRGGSSLDFFKYQPDERFFFAPGHEGVVAYGVSGGTAVALGDPVVRDDDAFAGLLAAWMAFVGRNGWRFAFHQVGPKWLPAYEAAGLAAVKIGEEAVVDLDCFTLSGNGMKSFRATVNRLGREGYRVVRHAPPLDASLLEALRDVSDEWLHYGHRRERNFTLGQFDEEYLRACTVFTVEDADGGVFAFANLVFDGVPGEATIDLMRRRQHPEGAMDYLFVSMLQELPAAGYHAFSLGMAPLANVGAESGATVIERALRQLYEHGDRLFSYRGLRAYKEKYHPRWEPRYTIYPNEAQLPFIVLAIARLTE